MISYFCFLSGLSLEYFVPSPFHGPGNDDLFNSLLVSVNPLHGEIVVRILDVLQGDFGFFPGDSHLAESLDDILSLHLASSETMFRGMRPDSFNYLGVFRFEDLVKFGKKLFLLLQRYHDLHVLGQRSSLSQQICNLLELVVEQSERHIFFGLLL